MRDIRAHCKVRARNSKWRILFFREYILSCKNLDLKTPIPAERDFDESLTLKRNRSVPFERVYRSIRVSEKDSNILWTFRRSRANLQSSHYVGYGRFTGYNSHSDMIHFWIFVISNVSFSLLFTSHKRLESIEKTYKVHTEET